MPSNRRYLASSLFKGNLHTYFTSLSSLSKKEIEKEVNEASPFIRGKLASLIDARNIPFLKFTYDESIEYGNKIDDIIKKIHQND